MKFDLKNTYKVQCAKEYLEKLIERKSWIELREMREPHSVDAHRLYFLWLNCIAKEMAMDKDELHYLYRATFLRKDEQYIESILKDGLWPKIKRQVDDFKFFPGMNIVIDIISESTSLLNQDSAQFSEYLKKIQKHARVKFNVILLNKEDQNFRDFYREFGFK